MGSVLPAVKCHTKIAASNFAPQNNESWNSKVPVLKGRTQVFMGFRRPMERSYYRWALVNTMKAYFSALFPTP